MLNRRKMLSALAACGLVVPIQESRGQVVPANNDAPVTIAKNGPFADKAVVDIQIAENALVCPKNVSIKKYGTKVFAGVTFIFCGNIAEANRLRVVLELFDQNGQILGSNTTVCKDNRHISQSSIPVNRGGIVFRTQPQNVECACITLTRDAPIASIRVRFEKP